ncbi:hypothetical protein LY78DRAFT_458265 [Colletotrichum sublineola]|nr:hypothetical protein LY78DRAFT_458265 [Colletotrichum sublineola]
MALTDQPSEAALFEGRSTRRWAESRIACRKWQGFRRLTSNRSKRKPVPGNYPTVLHRIGLEITSGTLDPRRTQPGGWYYHVTMRHWIVNTSLSVSSYILYKPVCLSIRQLAVSFKRHFALRCLYAQSGDFRDRYRDHCTDTNPPFNTYFPAVSCSTHARLAWPGSEPRQGLGSLPHRLACSPALFFVTFHFQRTPHLKGDTCKG